MQIPSFPVLIKMSAAVGPVVEMSLSNWVTPHFLSGLMTVDRQTDRQGLILLYCVQSEFLQFNFIFSRVEMHSKGQLDKFESQWSISLSAVLKHHKY